MCDQQQSKIIALGETLRQAREKIGLSQQEVAECLCLKLSVIQSIEEGYLNSLQIGSPFFRGYIRSYARLVHVSNESVVLNFFHMLDFQEFSSEFILERDKLYIYLYNVYYTYREKIFCFLMVVFFIITWILIQLFWKYSCNQVYHVNMFNTLLTYTSNYSISKDNKQFCIESSLPLMRFNIFLDNNFYLFNEFYQKFSLYPSVFNIDKTSCLLLSHDNYLTNVCNDLDIVNKDNNTLVLSFTSDCWLEVLDATGQILYVGTQHSGNILNILGDIPYKITIGAPRFVQIVYQGHKINLDRFICSNQVARFTVPIE